jgi:hypothetical protein
MFALSGVLIAVGLFVTWVGALLARKAESSWPGFDPRQTRLTRGPVPRVVLAFCVTGAGALCFLLGVVILCVSVGLALGGE